MGRFGAHFGPNFHRGVATAAIFAPPVHGRPRPRVAEQQQVQREVEEIYNSAYARTVGTSQGLALAKILKFFLATRGVVVAKIANLDIAINRARIALEFDSFTSNRLAIQYRLAALKRISAELIDGVSRATIDKGRRIKSLLSKINQIDSLE